MKKTIAVFIAITVTLIAVAATVFFVFQNQPAERVGPPVVPITRTIADLVVGLDFSKLHFADLPDDIRDEHLQRLDELRLNVQAEPNDAPAWRNYGWELKFLGDFEGAAVALEESVRLNPIGDIAMHNAADLYHNFLHDYDKAERYYKMAIVANPQGFYDYHGLAALYRYHLKRGPDAIEDILLQGVTNDPEGALDYYTVLVEYFTEQGNADKTAEYQRLLDDSQVKQDSAGSEKSTDETVKPTVE